MIDKENLDDIFGIPEDGSHMDADSGSADDVAFGSVISKSNSSKSFDDQIKSLSSNMSSVSINEEKIIEDLNKKNKKQKSGGTENVIQNEKNDSATFEDDGDIASEQRKSNDEVSSQSDIKLGDNVPVDGPKNNSSLVYEKTKNAEKIKSLSCYWKISEDDQFFGQFYSLKKNALNGWLLPGGEINFDLLQDELIDAKVDLSSIGFGDLKSMYDSMKEVQHWKDRVTEISIRVNAQYYAWKRAIELFRGTLARMHYEKPSEKQEGVVMEHMGDMVKYFSQLEAIHASVDAVSRNLDNAFDCISRQVSICLPVTGKDPDAIDRRIIKSNGESSEKILTNADSIPYYQGSKVRQNSDVRPMSKKIGTVDWKEF